jgi:hypothetical protein
MIKAVLFGLIIYFVYKTIKSFLMKEMGSKSFDVSVGERDDIMVKDPQCGVYFPEKDGVVLKQGREKIVFCSEKCRDEYLNKKER